VSSVGQRSSQHQSITSIHRGRKGPAAARSFPRIAPNRPSPPPNMFRPMAWPTRSRALGCCGSKESAVPRRPLWDEVASAFV
jgi:hypothetical protein